MRFFCWFFSPLIVFLHCIWSRCLLGCSLLTPCMPYIYFFGSWAIWIGICFHPGARAWLKEHHIEMRVAIWNVPNQRLTEAHMCGFDFSFKAFSIPVMFISVKIVNELWSPDVWNFFRGPTRLLYNSFEKHHRKFYTLKRYRHDWANPVIWTWFFLASSCLGPSDGTHVSYLKHLGFL